jgi:hypothetical protein
MIKEYAQGAAQDAVQPVADFIAPTVNVPSPVMRFKKYTERDRFRLPETRRAVGGRATVLQFDATDATLQCQPNALDYPVDILEEMAAGDIENQLMEGATAIAEVSGLVHEKRVIDAALAAAGAGVNISAGGADIVDVVDDGILAVLKAAKYGSLMGIGILSGATAFKRFKNSANIKGRFVTSGAGGKGLSAGTLVNVTPELASSLFLGQPELRISYMVYDNSAEGAAEDIQFILENSILVFARKANPTRRDPSFMKTFRLMGKWMVPGSYVRDDQRVEVAKFDWSEDIQVTNSAAVKRYNITA